jgi:protoheme IX farnesyltransferase
LENKTLSLEKSFTIGSRVADYAQLMKMRLSSLVVFSAAMGYVIAAGSSFSWPQLILLLIGGFLVTGSSNGFNQIIEKDLDKLMDRTAQRPLPENRLTVTEAFIASLLMGVAGVAILWIFMNPLTGVLSLASLLTYALLYTPLKRITSFSVFIGAIPGAIPPMLGWVAVRNEIGLEALILYAIQFIWQFPHFWAIAWVLDDDYRKAGFRLLPSAEGRGKSSAFQTMAYSFCLVPLALLPQYFGFANTAGTLFLVASSLVLIIPSVKLYRNCDMKSAQRLMFGSFIYLPVVQIVFMLGKLF